MSIARTIRIQKMQTRNRMVGQTFNPGGHTSESLDQREKDYIEKVKALPESEQKKLYDSFKEFEKWKHDNNYHFSNDFDHNCFMRNFRYKFA